MGEIKPLIFKAAVLMFINLSKRQIQNRTPSIEIEIPRKKGKAGCRQARLTGCVLGNTVTCGD